MPRIFTFLRDESGAVTVDYTVLLAMAAAAALVLATAWDEAYSDLTFALEQESEAQGLVSGTWAAAMRDYPPYNPDLYDQLVTDFSSLGDDDLDHMERYVNAYYAAMEPLVGTNATNQGLLDDLDFAMGLSYAKRQRLRPNDSDMPDILEVGRIAEDLGWGAGIIDAAYQGAQQVVDDSVPSEDDVVALLGEE